MTRARARSPSRSMTTSTSSSTRSSSTPTSGCGSPRTPGCGTSSSPPSTTTASPCSTAGSPTTRSPNSPFKRDVVKELADACHKAGLKLGYYYSPVDWHHPDYRTANHQQYIEYMHGQLREICTNYGQIDIIWFDGLGGTAKDWDSENLFKMIRQLQPHVIHQQPRGPARRPRHAGAAHRQVPERPALGDLHDHLPAVGLEAERPDEVAEGVHPDARPRHRRRRQPPVQRRPDARRPDRAATGGSAQGNGRLAPQVRREHLRHRAAAPSRPPPNSPAPARATRSTSTSSPGRATRSPCPPCRNAS